MWFDVTIPARALAGANEFVWLAVRSRRFAYGLEVGAGGLIHYQCKVWLDMDYNQVLRSRILAPFHVEQSRSDEKDYVYKDGCYFDTDMECTLDLSPAQEALQEFWITEGNNTRSVCVVVDQTGCTGKSWYGMSLEDLCLAVRVPQMPFEKISGFLMDQPKYGRYVFDLTKVVGKGKTDDLFSVIEELKNGQISDWRYKGRRWRYKLGTPVMILVLCNSLPKTETLSRDRWKVIYI